MTARVPMRLVSERPLIVVLSQVLLVLLGLGCTRESASPAKADPVEEIQNLIRERHFDEAEGRARAQLATLESSSEVEPLEIAHALDLLVLTLWSAGRADDDETFRLAKRSVEVKEAALGPDHPKVASSLNNLAALLTDAGDYEAARRAWKRALTIWQKAPEPPVLDVATCKNNLAGLLHKMGDYEEAKKLFEEALATRRKVLEPDHPALASTLNNLARLLHDMGQQNDVPADLKEAKKLFEEALEIRRQAGAGRRHAMASTLNNLGWLLFELDEKREAQLFLEDALKLREESLGKEHPHVAWTLENLSRLQQSRSDIERARALAERGLAIRLEAYGDRHPLVARSLSHLSTLLLRSGETERALKMSLEAEEISRDHMRLTFRTLPERQALRFASVRSSSLDVPLSVAVQGLVENAPRSAWNAVIQSRALVLDEMARRHRTAYAPASGAELTALAKRLAEARQRLANLTVRGVRSASLEEYRRAVDAARRSKEAAEEALAERSVEFRREKERQATGLDEVIRAVPSDWAIVAFWRYYDYRRLAEPGRKEDTPPPLSYTAFVLPKGERTARAVHLGAAKMIEELVGRWVEEISKAALLTDTEEKSLAASELACHKLGEALRQKIWEPVAKRLGGASKVLVVLDGELSRLNLVALPAERGGYLFETGLELHSISAERDLLEKGGRAKGKGLLVIGNPDFDTPSLFGKLATKAGSEKSDQDQTLVVSARSARGGRVDLKDLRFEALPGSEKEMDLIVSLWNQSPAAESETSLELRGPEATELAFKQQATGRRVLHLATHGFFLGEEESPRVLRQSRGISFAPFDSQPLSPVVVSNPLLRSGFALAGANHRASASLDEEDGILTAEEITALDLSGVEWAVLSACETGVGEIESGEGVLGLRRAFEMAGVGTLIVSLWSVDDKATSQWMEALYRARFVRGLSTSSAVHAAYAEVLKHRRQENLSTHPFFWAGFVAAGDWR